MKQELGKGLCYSWPKERGLEGTRKVQEVRPQEGREENPVEQFRTDVTVLKRCQRGRVKEQGKAAWTVFQ